MKNKNLRNAYYASVLEKPVAGDKKPKLKLKTHRNPVIDYDSTVKISKSIIKPRNKLNDFNAVRYLSIKIILKQ